MDKGRLASLELRTEAACRLFPRASRRAGLRGGEVERWAGLRLAPLELRAKVSLPSILEKSKVRPWASLRKEGMPMVHLLRAVLANTIGRLLADLVRRMFD